MGGEAEGEEDVDSVVGITFLDFRNTLQAHDQPAQTQVEPQQRAHRRAKGEKVYRILTLIPSSPLELRPSQRREQR